MNAMPAVLFIKHLRVRRARDAMRMSHQAWQEGLAEVAQAARQLEDRRADRLRLERMVLNFTGSGLDFQALDSACQASQQCLVHAAQALHRCRREEARLHQAYRTCADRWMAAQEAHRLAAAHWHQEQRRAHAIRLDTEEADTAETRSTALRSRATWGHGQT